MKAIVFSEDGEIASQMVNYLKGKAEVIASTLTEEKEKCIRAGAEKLYLLSGIAEPENISEAISEIKNATGADYIFIGSTANGRDIAGILSAKEDMKPISEITSFEINDGKATVTRFLYGGKAVATEETSATLYVYAPGISESAHAESDTPTETIQLKEPSVKPESEEPKTSGGVDLEKAKIIVSVGRGLGSKEGLGIAEELAKKVNGEIAGSRPVCLDYHWLSEDRQVGLSGKKVKPKVYIALGISGQIQHIAGIRGAKTVIAINKDKSAPIFEECDYGIVGDLFQIVPKLISAL